MKPQICYSSSHLLSSMAITSTAATAATTTASAATTTTRRKALSFWFYFTLSISLVTLLFSLFTLSPPTPTFSSSFLHLPSDLRRHYFSGTFIKLQQQLTTINLFSIQSHPQQQQHQQTSSDPVLLLHGLGLSSYSFRHVITSLAHTGIPAMAIDLPGSGFSDKIEDGGTQWGGPFRWVFDVLGEIREKGVFWAFDRLVETGQIPDVEKNANEDGGYVAELMGRHLGQVFDIMSERKPIHLVVHDSAWATVVNWVSMNPGLVRSLTLLDSSPAESPAFLFRALELRIIGDLIVKSHVLFSWLVKLCCLRSADGNEAAEMYRLMMKEGDGKRGIVGVGTGLNYSFDLGEWVNSVGVRDVKFQVLWSNSWSDRWIDEGRRIATQIPKARFAWHSGGRWPQEDAAEEIAGLITQFVLSLPKSVTRTNQEPPINRMFTEDGVDNHHHHYGHGDENAAHIFNMQGLGQEWGS